ncbi:FadR/GntR family transcriptional regulator [Paenibacillus montanisoli]|nr:FadR/GntR family transcriptional regulator [Paenibacillus montanisoli]
MDIQWDSNKVNAVNLSSPSLAEATAQRILDAIMDSKIKQSDPFPSQYLLCEWFGVSRTVVREATQILVSKGILDVKHGKRITIRPPSHEQIAESLSLAFRRGGVNVFDVLELRKVLESEVASLAALSADEQDLRVMKECLTYMQQHYNEEAGYVDADVEFHNAIFAAAKQPAFTLVLKSVSDYLHDSRKLSYRGEETTKRAIRAHEQIYEAIQSRDPAAAKIAMRKHLEETEEDLRESMKG